MKEVCEGKVFPEKEDDLQLLMPLCSFSLASLEADKYIPNDIFSPLMLFKVFFPYCSANKV